MKIKWTKHFIKYAVGAYYINEFHRRQNLCNNCQRENSPSYLVDVNVFYCNLSTLKKHVTWVIRTWSLSYFPYLLIAIFFCKLFFRCLYCVCYKETPEPIGFISVVQSQSLKKISVDLVFSDFVARFFILYNKHNRKRTGNSRFRVHNFKGEEVKLLTDSPVPKNMQLLAGQQLNED